MTNQLKTIGIIPARYASTRFPGKPLVLVSDRPLIQWVYEGCTGLFDYLTVATDDNRIYEAVKAFGGNVVMTSPDHPSGTDRCLEAADIVAKELGLHPDVVVNIQGDEPLIRKEQLAELLGCFDNPETEIATLVKQFGKDEDPENPDSVKVVAGTDHNALYFSRSVIPYLRDKQCESPYPCLKHVGLYAYRTEVLKKICKLPPSSLERAESLEQLRWLENGFTIRIRTTDYPNMGVDTPDDLRKIQNYVDDPRGNS
jgi:3-deoxy-manno-octulosonate cytidylyltransferase (CMP-KDO synthetase)